MDEVRGKDGAIAQQTLNMSHQAGFDAWLRNQKGLGKHGFYTAEDLLRQKRGGIEATDAMATSLPPLTTTAICFDKHGPPEEVPLTRTTLCASRLSLPVRMVKSPLMHRGPVALAGAVSGQS
jgi:hypothetical protein